VPRNAVLAALGAAYLRIFYPSDRVSDAAREAAADRVAIFAGAIVVSAVFWILDVRSNELVNEIQERAADLEGREGGAYSTLREVRENGREGVWPTHSLAVDALVSSVVTGALAYIVAGRRLGCLALAAVVLACILLLSLTLLRCLLRKRERSTSRAKFV